MTHNKDKAIKTFRIFENDKLKSESILLEIRKDVYRYFVYCIQFFVLTRVQLAFDNFSQLFKLRNG